MQEVLLFFQQNPYITGYLIIINLVTLFAYGMDKISARSHSWRTRERTLLLLALLGGSPAALLGMKLFRHKTRKNLFGFFLALIILLHSYLVFITYLASQAVMTN